MNTDKIFAEAIANEYAPKNTSKVMALKKSDSCPSALFHAETGTPAAVMLKQQMNTVFLYLCQILDNR